uniref:Protein disulfide isomerase-like 1-4 n=1 Tax=Oryza punctata TaxID=4537 RepID=A0A0E0MDH9_ORYPU
MRSSSRSLLLFALSLLLATPLLHSSASASASDDDLDYLIDNADDIPANDPDGWLQEGSPDDGDDDDLFHQAHDLQPVDETHVVLLSAANFSDFLASHRHVMVEFYAPWCAHCQALAPDYAAAAADLSPLAHEVALAKVDASEDTDLAQKYDVQGFPTILFFIDGVPKDYNGARTKEAIVSWVNKKLGPGVQNITTVDEAEKILTGEDKAILAVLDSLSGSHSDEIAAASRLEDAINFYQTSNPDVAKLFHVDPAAKRPSLVLLKKQEEEKLTFYDGQFKASAIADFVSANKLPLVITLTQETAPSIFDNPIKKQACLIILLFVVANESSKFLPIFKEASKSFKGKVLAYTGNEDARKFFLDGEMSVENIKRFAEDFLEEKLTPFYKSEPVPESNDGDVKIVVGKNLDQIVLDESKDALLEVCSSWKIYAPWCGHCQALEPTYNKLGKHLRGIDSLVIAKMDGTANEHPRAKPDGFPTILFYPAGKKSFEPITFEGDRTVVEMYKFIKKHASIPFKLKRPDSSATKTEKDQNTASTNLKGERSSGTNFKDEL